jgi:hypothetical protein
MFDADVYHIHYESVYSGYQVSDTTRSDYGDGHFKYLLIMICNLLFKSLRLAVRHPNLRLNQPSFHIEHHREVALEGSFKITPFGLCGDSIARCIEFFTRARRVF